MSIELILGGVGTALGIANFVYWSWWAKRDKVEVVAPAVYADFLPRGAQENFPLGDVTLACAVIAVEASCELVLKSGDQELEVKSVEVFLDKKTCNKLSKYFESNRRSRFCLYPVDDNNKKIPMLLTPKRSVIFQNKIPIDCTDEFEKEFGNLDFHPCQNMLQPMVDELESKYGICWTRYDDKKVCWRFPNRWWRNLGKKLWG